MVMIKNSGDNGSWYWNLCLGHILVHYIMAILDTSVHKHL